MIVSALDRPPGEVAFFDYEVALRAEGERLAEAARDAFAESEPVETVFVRSASPARELISEAADRDAAAIVVGSSHRGRAGRVLPGGVGERLLSGAPCAVLFAPRGFADREDPDLRRVGVGYDGSPESRIALEEAAALAGALAGSLRLLFALHEGELAGAGWAGIAPLTPSPAEERRLQRKWLEKELERVAAEQPARVLAAAEVVDGRPSAVLIEASHELDLLVMGSRSYGPARRVLFGAVSNSVARQAACPLLVTPRSAVEDLTGERVIDLAPPRIRALDDAG